jgi:hypothetical protein
VKNRFQNLPFKFNLQRYITTMQRSLRDLVFARWREGQCEERSDTHKAVGAVDLFVPFFPLNRAAVGGGCLHLNPKP